MLPEYPTLVEGVKATGAITAARFVSHAGLQITVANSLAMGVSRQDTAIGDRCPVGTLGLYEIETGGAFDPGDFLSTDNQGRAVKRTGQNVILGIARSKSTGASSRALIFLHTIPQDAIA